MNYLIKSLAFPPKGNQIRIFKYFNGRIGSFDHLLCCTTTLPPNTLPHRLHSHLEAELLISFCGSLEIMTSDFPQSQTQNTILVEPGSFVYHSPHQNHTLRCSGPDVTQYIYFKWSRKNNPYYQGKGTYYSNGGGQDREFIYHSNGFRILPIEGLSDYTKGAIQANLILLKPGYGNNVHKQNSDMVLILFEGELELHNVSINAPAFLYFAPRTPLGFNNNGSILAKYYVFEFQEPNEL